MKGKRFSISVAHVFIRIIAGGLLISMLLGCDEQIVHYLSENEANVLVTHLADVSISSKKVRQADGSWALAVDETDQLPALRALSAARLLRSNEPREPERGSLVVGRDEQRFRHERALSAEIERTLTTIPSVLEGRVHLNLPIVDPLFGQRLEKRPGSASVVVVVRGEGPSKEEIALIVSGASGIPVALVSVMMQQPPQHEVASTTRGILPLVDAAVASAPGVAPKLLGPAEIGVPNPSFFRAHRGLLIQIAVSLMIFGGGLLLLLRRRPSARNLSSAGIV